jgi:hypothetical protein
VEELVLVIVGPGVHDLEIAKMVRKWAEETPDLIHGQTTIEQCADIARRIREGPGVNVRCAVGAWDEAVGVMTDWLSTIEIEVKTTQTSPTSPPWFADYLAAVTRCEESDPAWSDVEAIQGVIDAARQIEVGMWQSFLPSTVITKEAVVSPIIGTEGTRTSPTAGQCLTDRVSGQYKVDRFMGVSRPAATRGDFSGMAGRASDDQITHVFAYLRPFPL